MDGNQKETIYPSALFGYDDQAYELHMRSSIAVLNKVVASGEDILVEAPMATRVLLDFYYETLRRYLLWKRK